MDALKLELSVLSSGGISMNSITASLVLISEMTDSSADVLEARFEFMYAFSKHLSNESAKQYVQIEETTNMQYACR